MNLSDILFFAQFAPVVLIIFGVVCAVVLAYWERKSARLMLKAFTVNRVFDTGTLIGLSGVAWTVMLGEYMHYSLALFIGGFVAFVMAWGRRKSPTNKTREVTPKPMNSRSYFYGGISFISGLFTMFTAYTVFPSLTNVEGWFTFALLVMLTLIFLLRVIPLVRVHVLGGLGIITVIGMNVYPALLAEHQFLGLRFQLNEAVAFGLTIMLIIFCVAVVYGFLKWLNESASEVSRGLRSFPVLASVGAVCMIWGIRLVMISGWQP